MSGTPPLNGAFEMEIEAGPEEYVQPETTLSDVVDYICHRVTGCAVYLSLLPLRCCRRFCIACIATVFFAYFTILFVVVNFLGRDEDPPMPNHINGRPVHGRTLEETNTIDTDSRSSLGLDESFNSFRRGRSVQHASRDLQDPLAADPAGFLRDHIQFNIYDGDGHASRTLACFRAHEQLRDLVNSLHGQEILQRCIKDIESGQSKEDEDLFLSQTTLLNQNTTDITAFAECNPKLIRFDQCLQAQNITTESSTAEVQRISRRAFEPRVFPGASLDIERLNECIKDGTKTDPPGPATTSGSPEYQAARNICEKIQEREVRILSICLWIFVACVAVVCILAFVNCMDSLFRVKRRRAALGGALDDGIVVRNDRHARNGAGKRGKWFNAVFRRQKPDDVQLQNTGRSSGQTEPRMTADSNSPHLPPPPPSYANPFEDEGSPSRRRRSRSSASLHSARRAPGPRPHGNAASLYGMHQDRLDTIDSSRGENSAGQVEMR